MLGKLGTPHYVTGVLKSAMDLRLSRDFLTVLSDSRVELHGSSWRDVFRYAWSHDSFFFTGCVVAVKEEKRGGTVVHNMYLVSCVLYLFFSRKIRF